MTARLANPATAKDPRRTWYSLQQWKTRRAHQLRAEPLCAICMEQNRVTPATVADHHPPHYGGWNAFRLGRCDRCVAIVMLANGLTIVWAIPAISTRTAFQSTPAIRSTAGRWARARSVAPSARLGTQLVPGDVGE